MANKEHVLEIYKVEAEKYDKTREIQWKMNLAVWTMLILAIVAKSKWDFNLADSISDSGEWIAYSLFLVLYGWFISRIQESLKFSLRRMRYLAVYTLEKRDTVLIKWDDIHKGDDMTKEQKKHEKLKNAVWIIFEVCLTVILLLVLKFTNDTKIFY